MKIKIFYILFTIVCGSFIMYLLSLKENQEKNAFTRKFINPNIKLKHVIKLTTQFLLAEKPKDKIILDNYKDKSHLYSIDFSLKEIDTIPLHTPKGFNKSLNVYKASLESSIYLTNSFSEIVTFNQAIINSYKISNLNFDVFRPISQKSLVVRARKEIEKEKDRQLVKLSLKKSASIIKIFTIPKQIDGFFCNDGWLHFDEANSVIFYMYYYRGEFLCLDTNLNLKYKAKTIDTITKANIKTAFSSTRLNNGTRFNQVVPKNPPKLVNRHLTTNNDHVYVLSGLKADNETQSEFQSNQQVDVYSTKNGKYLHSFYIPKYKNQKLNYFEIKGDTIVAVFGIYLVTFNFKD